MPPTFSRRRLSEFSIPSRKRARSEEKCYRSSWNDNGQWRASQGEAALPYWQNCQISRASIIFSLVFENRDPFCLFVFRKNSEYFKQRILSVGTRTRAKKSPAQSTSEGTGLQATFLVQQRNHSSTDQPVSLFAPPLRQSRAAFAESRETRSSFFAPASNENRSHDLVHTEARARPLPYARTYGGHSYA